jgi:hypothetical protein
MLGSSRTRTVSSSRSFFKEARRTMKNERDPKADSTITLSSIWTFDRATKSLPYLRAVARSVRERWLHMAWARLQVRRLGAGCGRLDRHGMILRADAGREAARAEGQFNEGLGELEEIDVRCLDPARGLALIPFRHGDDLAWFIFDLFDARGLVGWRFHSDPLETLRKVRLADIDPGPADRESSSRPWFLKRPQLGQWPRW